MKRQRQINNDVDQAIVKVDQYTKKMLQGLLTAFERGMPMSIPQSSMALLAMWLASDFLDACGWIVGCHEHNGTYFCSVTTRQILALQIACYLPDPLLNAPGYVATQSGPHPTAESQSHL